MLLLSLKRDEKLHGTLIDEQDASLIYTANDTFKRKKLQVYSFESHSHSLDNDKCKVIIIVVVER